MNLILISESDYSAPDRVILQGRRFAHITSVHNARPGETLVVGLVNQGMGTGTVLTVAGSFVELAVSIHTPPPPPLPITLILALPRPKMLRRILQSVTSLGVKTIVLINSWRVEKSFWSSPVLEPDAIRNELILGLEQSRDTRMPSVIQRRLFKPFVLDELPRIAEGSLALAAHPKTSDVCPTHVRQPVTLAVGPEGGFIDFEIETLESVGFKTVSLGPRILRVETALPVLISRLFP
ncbi:MAG: 16S rRNA (uracil(1498)-N(3))-methyltransferase [Pseudomonadota bacterium]